MISCFSEKKEKILLGVLMNSIGDCLQVNLPFDWLKLRC